MTSNKKATQHYLIRTSSKGEDFIGTCNLCGKENLSFEDMNNECKNTAGLTQEEVLVEAIKGQTMTNYVLGFMFNYDATHVVLLKKISKKKEHQHMHGLLNGVGGKIEENESPYDAMVREFAEEARIETSWKPLTSVDVGNGEVMFVFSCFSNLYHNVKQMEEEEIVRVPLELVGTKGYECPENIHGFIQQALEDR